MGVHPPLANPSYRSTLLRSPKRPLVPLPQGLTEVTGPVFGQERAVAADADLTMRHAGEPLGERIIVTGRVLDSGGRPVPDTLVEIWQANAAGRYAHEVDQHPAPLDPNFDGAGRCLTDSEGRYRFVTIKPGAYPWHNHPNAWRPAHIHFSLFGRAFTQRLITQMYFPGDPLFAQDPIFNSVPDPAARQRMICRFDLSITQPEWALGYEWDIVLRGPARMRLRGGGGALVTSPRTLPLTPSQTAGPFFAIGMPWPDGPYVVPEGTPGAITIGGTVRDGAGQPVTDAMVETWQADADGRFAHPDDPRGSSAAPGFRGFGRCLTDEAGRYRIVTLRPGPLPFGLGEGGRGLGGAAPGCLGVRARPARPARDQDLFS